MLSVMCYSDGKLTKATSLRFDFHLIDHYKKATINLNVENKWQ